MEKLRFFLKVVLSLCAFSVVKTTAACTPAAQFTGWKNFILPNDIIQLTGPAGPIGFQWFLNGALSTTSPVFTFQPSQSGTYQIQLIVNNGSCQDTSDIWILTVGSCGEYDENQKMFWALEDSMMVDFTGMPAISTAGRLHGLTFPLQGSYLEHSVSLSDDLGDLMFYSNGEKIWDRLHQVMPNGNGIFGHYSTYQGSLSFAAPGEPDVYYLVTLDALENFGLNGLRYSKIDMNLRGGLGDVIPTEKNVLIRTTEMEVMDATYHANGKDVWLVVGEASSTVPVSYRLRTLLVTENGVSAPIHTNAQTNMPGYIKFSHDGKWMVCGSQLFRFDRASGQLQSFVDFNFAIGTFIRAVEFSPNNQVLYMQTFFGDLTQFDLSLAAPLSVRNSGITIYPVGSTFSAYLERLELGPNGKIYAVGSFTNSLAYIDFPNSLGQSCNLEMTGLPYPNNFFFKSINLPTYISGQYTNDSLRIVSNDSTPCVGDTIKLYPLCTIGTYGFSYFINGDTLLPTRGDTLLYSPQQAGPLTLIGHLENACGNYYDTLRIDVKPLTSFDLGPPQTLCEDSLLLDMTHLQPAHFLWFDGSTNPDVYVYQVGRYWLQLTDTLWQCSNRDSIEILRKPLLYMPNLGNDTAFCLGGSTLLSARKGDGEILWQDGSTNENLLASQGGWYWVEVSDSCGRKMRDSLFIDVRPPQARGIVDSLFFCPQTEVSIDAQSPGYSGYRWADGPIGAIRTFTSPGKFYIEAMDNIGCIVRDTLDVIRYDDPPELNLPEIDSLCAGDELVVNAQTEGLGFYVWENNLEGPVRSFSQGGNFQLMATDENGCESEGNITIRYYEAIQVVLPEEIIACRQDPPVMEVESDSFLTYIWQDGVRIGNRTIDSAGLYSLAVEDIHHCISSDEIRVKFAYCRPEAFMASAFSPNGDAINDFFGPSYNEGIIRYELAIYNRWGQQVYVSENPFPGWDGNFKGLSCPEGVYMYTLTYQTDQQTVSHVQGTVTLIR